MRAASLCRTYGPAFKNAVAEGFSLWFFTGTIKNKPSLKEALDDLTGALKRMQQAFRNRDRVENCFKACDGGVFSIEIKKGKNSGLWHPHVHGVLVYPVGLEPKKGSIEATWAETIKKKLGYRANAHVVQADQKSLYELLKYSLKFQDLKPLEQLEATRVANRRRLFFRWGVRFEKLKPVPIVEVAPDVQCMRFYEWHPDVEKYGELRASVSPCCTRKESGA